MKKWAKVLIICFFVCIMFLLNGCYDSHNIDDLSYVLSIGFDVGVSKKYRYTIQIPELGTQQEDTAGDVRALTIEADTLQEATDLMNTSLPWRLNYSHLNYLVFSEDLAREDQIKIILQPSPRLLHITQSTDLFIAKGTAEQFLRGLESDGTQNFAKLQRDMLLEPNLTGLYPEGQLFQFYEGASTQYYDVVLPVGAFNPDVESQKGSSAGGDKEGQNEEEQETAEDSKLQDEAIEKLAEEGIDYNRSYAPYNLYAGEIQRTGLLKTELYGCALFNDGKMVDELNGEETQLLLMGKGDFSSGFFSIPKDDGQNIMLQLTQIDKPKVRLELYPQPVAKISLYLEAEIISDRQDQEKLVPYQEGMDIPEDEASVEQFVRRNLEIIGKNCIKNSSDALGLGRYAVRKFKTRDEWETYNWKSHMKDLTINWDINVEVLFNENDVFKFYR